MVDLLLAGRWLLAALLVAAGARKLLSRDRGGRAKAVSNYGLLPGVLVKPFAAVLPWLEIALGAMLAAGVMVVLAAVAVAVMLITFAALVSWHASRGHRFGCGCGGGGQISWMLAGRDALLSAVAAGVATGPSAGLAAWPGWPAASVAASWQALLPVPLVVILLLGALRLLLAGRVGWRSLLPRQSGYRVR